MKFKLNKLKLDCVTLKELQHFDILTLINYELCKDKANDIETL